MERLCVCVMYVHGFSTGLRRGYFCLAPDLSSHDCFVILQLSMSGFVFKTTWCDLAAFSSMSSYCIAAPSLAPLFGKRIVKVQGFQLNYAWDIFEPACLEHILTLIVKIVLFNKLLLLIPVYFPLNIVLVLNFTLLHNSLRRETMRFFSNHASFFKTTNITSDPF